jgi:hypothetical protein
MKKSANTHPKHEHAVGESNGATEHQNGASHVSVVVSKKIRNAKKRLAKAEEIQRKADSGKELNDDQQLALKHVDRVKGLIEELEKLCGVLDEAVEKDVQVAVEKKEQQMVEEMERVMREKEVSSKNAIKAAVKRAKAEGVNRVKQLERKMEAEKKSAMVEGAQKMVEFLYMSALFDPFMPYQVEKTAVMNFMKESGDDCVDVDAQRAMAERLDMIGVLGKMMTSQPLHAGLSHEEGVTQCQEIAKQYIDGDDGEVLNGTMTRAEVIGLVERVKGLGYYKVPVAPPVSAAVPPPPPPPMEAHVSEYHTFPEYVTPEAAAATGQNVLNQFFAAPVQPGLDAVGYSSQYDGLGMHEVVEEHRDMQHITVVEPQHYQQPQPIQEEEEEPRDDAVMNGEEESSRQIMRSNRTRKQVYYKNNSKKKNSNHGAWKESALVNDSGSNTRKFHRGTRKYGHQQQQHKHREQDARV